VTQAEAPARSRPILTHPELVIAAAAAAAVVWELVCRLGPLRSWPAGAPLGYTLLPAMLLAWALWHVADSADSIRPSRAVVIIGLEAIALLAVHRALGPDDAEISNLYLRYGREILDNWELPIAEYPPLALVLLAIVTALGSPPLTLPLLSLPLLLAAVYVTARFARGAAWIAVAVVIWPTLLAFWEVRFDAVAAGLFVLAIHCAVRDRWAAVGLLLGAGAFVKWYPAIAMLPLAIALVRTQRVHQLVRMVVGFVAVAASTTILVLATSSSDALTNPYRFQSGRLLTGESLFFTLLRPLGLAEAGEFPWDAAVAARSWTTIALVVQVVAVIAVCVWVWRKPSEMMRAGALVTVAWLATNRVFSAQFNLFVFVALGVALALSTLTVDRRRLLAVLLGTMAVTNFSVFPGHDSFWFATKVVYWVCLSATIVLLLRSSATTASSIERS
jgi:hypothetical protein